MLKSVSQTLHSQRQKLYLQFSYGQVPRFWLIYHLLHAEFAAFKLPLLIVWDRAMKFQVLYIPGQSTI